MPGFGKIDSRNGDVATWRRRHGMMNGKQAGQETNVDSKDQTSDGTLGEGEWVIRANETH